MSISPRSHTATMRQIMMDFAQITGLTNTTIKPKRYLWTDAFAVCNYLQLHKETKETQYIDLAERLVEQVHQVLGKHRDDDARSGWISGMTEEEGKRHPTAGGLRIGKKHNERKMSDAYDSEREWSQDGQYFHYNTKWMWALGRMYDETHEEKYLRWGFELAKRSHQGFVYSTGGRSKRMYWKMAIDLSRPAVTSMGHHDPLDGLLTYLSLEFRKPRESTEEWPSLRTEIEDMFDICSSQSFQTSDSLGLGGLLTDVHRGLYLLEGSSKKERLLQSLINDTRISLKVFEHKNSLSYPMAYRLAFRELGLSIGLRAMERVTPDELKKHPKVGDLRDSELAFKIENCWLKKENQEARNWIDHREINMVMLATSLAPDGFLGSVLNVERSESH